jgi:uncharacterized coiled-coil DUF342 family protein
MTGLEITLLVLLLISLFFNVSGIKALMYEMEQFNKLRKELDKLFEDHMAQTKDIERLRESYDSLLKNVVKYSDTIKQIRQLTHMDSEDYEKPNSP